MPHYGELFFHEDVCKLELRSTSDEGEANETKKVKKNIDLRGNLAVPNFFRSLSVSGQVPSYPSPNPTLTFTRCQLTVVELGEG